MTPILLWWIGVCFCGSLTLKLTIRSHPEGDKFNPLLILYLSIVAFLYLRKIYSLWKSPYNTNPCWRLEVMTKSLFGICAIAIVPYRYCANCWICKWNLGIPNILNRLRRFKIGHAVIFWVLITRLQLNFYMEKLAGLGQNTEFT